MVCQTGTSASTRAIHDRGTQRRELAMCIIGGISRGFNAFGMMMKCDDIMKVRNEKSIDQQHT